MAEIVYTLVRWNNQYRIDVRIYGLKKSPEYEKKSGGVMRGKKKSFAEYLEEALKKTEKG